MSKLLNTYANYCGVRVSHKPELPESYFPSPERYITVHNSSGLPAKNYDYYSEVMALIKPYLDKAGIVIVQVGDKDDKQIEFAISYQGRTTMRQGAYVVKNSLLHIGNDSIWVHFAAAKNVPVVALYGTTLSQVCGPTWHGKTALIDSHRNGNRATNSAQEEPKTINFIKPEEVAKKVLSLLGLEHSINTETVFIGKDYHREILEIVPDIKNPRAVLKDQFLNMRMDYHFNEEVLHYHLGFNKSSISTEKPINIDLLMSRRNTVAMVIYYINEDYSKEFIKKMHYAGLPYKLFSSIKGDKLNKIRIDLFDFNPVEEKPEYSQKDIGNMENLTYNTVFKSNKFILSKGKVYTSLYHYKNDINISDGHKNVLQIGKALGDKEFWSQANHYYIFNYV